MRDTRVYAAIVVMMITLASCNIKVALADFKYDEHAFRKFSSRRRDIRENASDPKDQHAAASSACESMDYCSLGVVSPWKGDVWPSTGLRASVMARSYKKELIVIGESRVNPFIQVVGRVLENR